MWFMRKAAARVIQHQNRLTTTQPIQEVRIMADENYTDLPDGVFINRECDSQIQYSGTEAAMLAAGLIQAEWLEGLSTYTRSIVLAPDSGFLILREGKGNCITNAHRDAGAITIKRLKGGELQVSKYRTCGEKKPVKMHGTPNIKKNRSRKYGSWQSWRGSVIIWLNGKPT